MSTTPPDISIIIINYNTFELTSACIGSLYQKIEDVSFEIIVVDNASAERIPDEFKALFPEIILIKSPVNVGFARGNNLGIAKAIGKYILLLNSDTTLINDAVSIVHHYLIREPQVGVATCRLEYPDGSVQNNCQRFPKAGPKIFELLRLQKIFPRHFSEEILLGPFFSYDRVIFPDWVWGTFFMFKKDLLHKLPDQKLADDFFMYVEDIEWCYQFHIIGHKIAFLPQGRIVHYMGRSGGQKQMSMRVNMELFYKKYYSAIHVWVINILDKILNFSLHA
jgi:GT2 family glycosyltransferase